MSLRSVSIWFQNRRQAMKKRASRFGGIDGVRGASVTAMSGHANGSRHVSDGVYPPTTQSALAQSGLKRWASLDDVAVRANLISVDSPRTKGEAHRDHTDSTAAIQQRVAMMMQPTPSSTETKCSAPILDFLRRHKSGALSRVTSMPSIAAALAPCESTPRKARDDAVNGKDLNDIWRGAASATTPRSAGLQRSISMRPFAPTGPHRSNATPAQTPHRAIEAMHDPSGASWDAIDPAPLADETDTSSHELPQSVDSVRKLMTNTIWKHMLSSSSNMSGSDLSSDAMSGDSDKENHRRGVARATADDDAYEDEERTLRRIASRRAAREKAKQEQRLSREGAQYLQEADARLVLQHKNQHDAPRAQPRTPFEPLSAKGRTLNRSASAVVGRGRSALSRIASLDLSAGRDRSKAPERPLLDILSEFERERQRRNAAQRRADQRRASAAVARNSLRRVHSNPQGSSYSRRADDTASTTGPYSTALHGSRGGGLMERHMGMAHTVMPNLMRTASGPMSLMPSRSASRYYSGPMVPGFMTRHLDGRGSMGRLAYPSTDFVQSSRERHSLSASQDSSVSSRSSEAGSSEEWTESWVRERARNPLTVAPSSERGDRCATSAGDARRWWTNGTLGNTVPTAARGTRIAKRASPEAWAGGHDDSGFFDGSDDDDAENVAPDAAARAHGPAKSSQTPWTKKRRVGAFAPLGSGKPQTKQTPLPKQHQQRSPLRPKGHTSNNVLSPRSASAASSSPFKRGDERDRLAAETLLGLGSHA